MFSGIHSLFFGKKHSKSHHQTVDDSAVNVPSTDSDKVVVERRHSDDTDVMPSMYPQLDPSGGLPYGVSPSLPNLREKNALQKKGKEDHIVDILDGVPFELASYIDQMKNENENIIPDTLSEESIDNGYKYSFDLEYKVLQEFNS